VAETALDEVLERVSGQAEAYIARLREWVRRPSTTGDRAELTAFAGFCAEDLGRHGWSAGPVRIGADAPPFILARWPSHGRRTLLVYSHYDVVSAEPAGAWTYPPFGATRVNGAIIGRGATDAKGNALAVACAVEATSEVRGEPPCGIALLLEGEEESGSEHLREAVDAVRESVPVDAAMSFDGGMHSSGVPKIGFGTSGMALLELSSRNGGGDLHAASGRLVPNPAWRLVWALAAIKAADERVPVPGFDDAIVPPTPRDRELMEAMPWRDEPLLAEAGVPSFVAGLSGRAALERLLFSPGLTICGIQAGYVGEGGKAIIPGQATARLEIRIVAGQTPEGVLAQIRRHLDASGLADVEVRLLASVETAKTDPSSHLAQAVVAAARQIYGGAVVKPTEEYAGRQGAWLGQELGVPGVQAGVGPPRFNGHSPDEFITEDAFVNGVKFAAAVLDFYAASPS
jgi:acetylornithine deacetylase/succinyl-diaminopimelate desuccinylase-like protein